MTGLDFIGPNGCWKINFDEDDHGNLKAGRRKHYDR